MKQFYSKIPARVLDIYRAEKTLKFVFVKISGLFLVHFLLDWNFTLKWMDKLGVETRETKQVMRPSAYLATSKCNDNQKKAIIFATVEVFCQLSHHLFFSSLLSDWPVSGSRPLLHSVPSVFLLCQPAVHLSFNHLTWSFRAPEHESLKWWSPSVRVYCSSDMQPNAALLLDDGVS